MSQALRLVLLKQIPDDPHLRQQWNALVERVSHPQVFYTYEWALAVQRAYSATLHPLLFLFYDERDALCGLAALAANVEADRVSFLCATTGDYCDFVSRPEHKPAFVAAVLAELKKQGLNNITLTNLPADSDTVAAIRRSSVPNCYRCFARTAYICAQVALAKLERQPGENKLVLPGKKMVRRSLKEMGRNAPVRLHHARSWDAVRPILPQFIESHVARFLATGRISNLVRPERRLFLEELAKLLSVPGWIALSRLMAGDNVFAWNYGFQFQGTWFWYQPTFDSDLEKLSPGFCLLTKLIEDAAEHPDVNTVDLGLGAEEYKDRFANQNRETLYLTLTVSSTQHAREILRYRAAQIVKSQARLEVAARAVVGRVAELRQSARGAGIVGGLRLMSNRLGTFLWSEKRVLFLEWSGAFVPESGTSRLQPIDLKQLASAAELYFDDQATLEYLLRCAVRLRKKTAEGFALSNSDGSFLCFVWVAAFDGYSLPELNARVEAPSADSVILDCWTPISARGHGYNERTIRLITNQLQDKGKRVWTFCAENEANSVRELENAGFQKRYSLLVRQVLGRQKIEGKTPVAMPVPATEVSSRVS